MKKADLPGYYFDPEKNRYFPLKGPIPGSSSSSSSPSLKQKPSTSTPTPTPTPTPFHSSTFKLIQDRALYGHLPFSSFNFNFIDHLHSSKPLLWKYPRMPSIADTALQHLPIHIHTLEGLTPSSLLLTGSLSGSFSILGVGKHNQPIPHHVNCIPERVWPSTGEKQLFGEVPGDICHLPGASLQMSSSISCIQLFRKCFPLVQDHVSDIHHALITTLGSDTSGGSVYVLNLFQPLDFNPSIPVIRRRMHKVTSINCSIWTADCQSNGVKTVIGTNTGAASVDLGTGKISWILRGKSDVFALQLIHSENVVLCGLRNGMIMTVDTRERQEVSKRLLRHQIPYLPVDRNAGTSAKQWFKLTGNIFPSCTVKMPSSISSLVSLQFDDRYFLASSMDGTVRLYDHRLIQRGAVQTYDGHANSHTRIQLGVDPTERFVVSGGEDCNFRLWNIKSGKLLFEDRFADDVLSTICWQRAGNHSSGAWLGSQGGLYYAHWPMT